MGPARGARGETARRAGVAAAAAVGLLSLTGLACELPPEYPRDETHLDADSARVCFDCHVLENGPRPHPSHFEEDGTVKASRRDCLDCHRLAVPDARGIDALERDE